MVYIKSIFEKTKRISMNYIDIIHGVLLVFVNGANVALAIFGLIMKYSFATHVLTVLITNGVLYTMFYIIMKVLYKEKIMKQTPVLIVLALACWVPSLYFFLTTVTTWEETPAQSRNRNQECLLVRYYDSHDIWHFLSAFALFFTCWILLTLDEGLDHTPRQDIVDFHDGKSIIHTVTEITIVENPRNGEITINERTEEIENDITIIEENDITIIEENEDGTQEEERENGTTEGLRERNNGTLLIN